ncbi:lysylphosphatidylglycerol synthase transmembrane domain-containing protein [Barrientosiimonas marina]|uniref:Phosphatidylglycerol lysyltransferase n=1 Tax=Lentibacillus kimchii TaxID=1542911 RepID=A0ABW2UUE3_9BACI
MKRTGYGRLFPKVITGVMLGVIVVAVLLLFGDLQRVGDVLVTMPWQMLGLAFLLTLASYGLRLWKWQAFSRWASFPVSRRDNTAIFFIGLMMSITPGKAGELIKSYLLKQRAGVAYTASAPVVIYDRLSDLLAMLLLIGSGLLIYPIGAPLILLVAVAIVAFFLLLGRRQLTGWLIQLVTRPRRLRRFRLGLHRFYRQMRFFMQFRLLSFSFLLSAAAWLLECVSLYVVIQAVGVDISLAASILIFSLGTLAGALSMIPGGLGVAEGSIAGLLVYFGAGGSMAVTISLVIRFVTLWFGVILGVLVFLLTRRRFSG